MTRKEGATSFRKSAVILAFAVAGWAWCGALIGVGRQFLPMNLTLIVHATGAPIGFAALSWFYHRRFAFTAPIVTAGLFLFVVIALDVFVVALLVEKSFAMFASPLGTWIPFALIFGSTYVVGSLARAGT